MRIAKNFFNDFKSVFTGKDVLKENERHANIVVATAMINMFVPLIIIFILAIIVIFKSETKGIGDIILFTIVGFIIASIIGIIGLIIPARICYKRKGEGKNLKYILIASLLITMSLVDMLLSYKATLILVIPIIFAARYYSKKLTVNVAIITAILFAISTYIGAYAGFLDLNYVNIPQGTTITIQTTLAEAVENMKINERENAYNLLVGSYLPELLIYIFFIAYACVQISQSGRNMIDRQKELSEESARIESELNLARGIQKDMLPSTFPAFPEHKEIDIFANMIPAKEVGGDFYDMFLIDDDHLAVTIADVSGKGVPAALIMMISRTLIKNTALNKYSVDEAFYKVNNLMCEDNTVNNFVTSWFGILDLKTGNMEYVNAGHNAPLIYKKKNKKFEFIKDKPNLVLAAMENTKYTKHELKLEPGDRLFLYTDGVVEATSVNKELYGDDRLYNYLNSNINKTLNDTIKDLKMDIDNFVGEEKQFDDITMLELLFKDYKKETKEEKKFKADISNLDDVLSYLDDYVNKYNVSQKIIKQMELVVEELFVNVCSYAYEKGKGYFNLSLSYSNDIFEMIIEDEGIKFNPLKRIDPDITLSSEDRSIGGLGILLVKKNMDNIKYKRNDNKNILVLEKSVKEEK